MAVTITDTRQIGPRTWTFTWASSLTDPMFYVYRNGLLAGITNHTSMSFEVAAGERLDIEVFDDADAIPGRTYPGRLRLGWQAADGAIAYRVEEFVDTAWVTRRRILETGRGYYIYETRWLDDETEYNWRVVSESAYGVDGGTLEFTGLMVRTPDRAELGWSYDSETGRVTLSSG